MDPEHGQHHILTAIWYIPSDVVERLEASTQEETGRLDPSALNRLEYWKTSLEYFKTRTGAEHAFEVVMNMPYEDVDCFAYDYPVRVPAATFLSQLI